MTHRLQPEATKTASDTYDKNIFAPILRQAFEQGEVDAALLQLYGLEQGEDTNLASRAAFERAHLLLYFYFPDALSYARYLQQYDADHRMMPLLQLWLARWWREQQDDKQAMVHIEAGLTHAKLSEATAKDLIALGAPIARGMPDQEAAIWFLAAIHHDRAGRDRWVREAVAHASMPVIAHLRDRGLLQGEVGELFYLQAARARLLVGDMGAVDRLTHYLQEDAPEAEELTTLQAWKEGEAAKGVVGVMVPLSGRYARYGEQVLRGVRLALASLEQGSYLSLRIEDSGSDDESCLAAWARLTHDDVRFVIGPLLSSCVEAIANRGISQPSVSRLPVLTLSNRVDAIGTSDTLFAHSLSHVMQAKFMAADAWQHGSRRMTLVHSSSVASQLEAEAFQYEFERLGGKIAHRIGLASQTVDFRDALQQMREATDDEQLLADLDESMALSVVGGLEIRLPVNFDGIYLALPGKEVALLAGQLAYVDIADVNLYGSGRWQDGHLLDDKGRYMQHARFCDVQFPLGNTPDIRRMKLLYRDAWGEREPGKLTGLAFDSALIAAMLVSRLGLVGESLLQQLHDPAGFPGVTGHVRFDEHGVGIKAFDMFRIRRGTIIPAG
ncbi:MAG: penicillin-binding protein activator [Mariprofundaceae bacterium]